MGHYSRFDRAHRRRRPIPSSRSTAPEPFPAAKLTRCLVRVRASLRRVHPVPPVPKFAPELCGRRRLSFGHPRRVARPSNASTNERGTPHQERPNRCQPQPALCRCEESGTTIQVRNTPQLSTEVRNQKTPFAMTHRERRPLDFSDCRQRFQARHCAASSSRIQDDERASMFSFEGPGRGERRRSHTPQSR
jgi:hypothetical protein